MYHLRKSKETQGRAYGATLWKGSALANACLFAMIPTIASGWCNVPACVGDQYADYHQHTGDLSSMSCPSQVKLYRSEVTSSDVGLKRDYIVRIARDDADLPEGGGLLNEVREAFESRQVVVGWGNKFLYIVKAAVEVEAGVVLCDCNWPTYSGS
jgi:hypothetical protein